MEEEQSIENTLKSVKNLINSPQKTSDCHTEILELTEDDLFDELDVDYQEEDDNIKIEEKITSINQMLTSIDNNHNSVNKNNLNEVSLDKGISEEVAAKSAAHLRNIIKKMELPMENTISSSKHFGLEQLIIDALKPYLNEWLEQNVAIIVQRELKNLVSKQNKKDD